MATDEDRKRAHEEFVKAAIGVAKTSAEGAAIVLAYAAKVVRVPESEKKEEEKKN